MGGSLTAPRALTLTQAFGPLKDRREVCASPFRLDLGAPAKRFTPPPRQLVATPPVGVTVGVMWDIGASSVFRRASLGVIFMVSGPGYNTALDSQDFDDRGIHNSIESVDYLQ